MGHQAYRDPLDPVPKWERRKSVPPPVPEDYWGHISDTANKVKQLASPQSSAYSPPQKPNIQEPAITTTESFIVVQLLKLPNRRGLNLACSDPSGEQFLAFSAPLIDRLRMSIDEEINSGHILFYLRQKLEITTP